MKNFARLVRFAWPYRLRFGLSLICALLVALLWCANISAVLPLLKILFYESENCQKWVAQKVASLETEVQMLDVRRAELDFIQHAGDPTSPILKGHFQRVHNEREAKTLEVGRRERTLDALPVVGRHDQRAPQGRAALDELRHELQLAEA